MALDERLDSLRDTVQDQRQHFTDTCSQIERNAAEKSSDNAEQQDDLAKQITRECCRLEKLLSTGKVAQEESLAGQSKLSDEQHTQLSETVSKMDQRITARAEALDGEAMKLSDEIKTNYQKFADSSLRTEQKLSAKDDDQQIRIDELFATVGQQGQHITSSTESLSRRLNEKANEIQESQTQERQWVKELCKNLEGGVASQCTLLDNRLGEKFDRAMAQLQDMDRKFEGKTASNATRLNDLTSIVDEHYGNSQSLITNLDLRFTDKTDAIETRLNSHHQHVGDVCANLELKFLEKSAAQDLRLDELSGSQLQQHKHFTDIFTRLERSFTDENLAQDKRTEGQYQHLSQVLGRADGRSNEKDKTHDAKLDELNSTLSEYNQRLTNTCADMNSRFTEKNASQDDRLEQFHGHFTDQIKNLAVNAAENNAAHDNQLDLLSAKEDGNRRHMTDRCDTLEKKVLAKNVAQDEVIESNYQQLSDKCSSLDSRYSEKTHKQEVRVDELTRVTQENDRRHTDTFSLLQSKFTENSLRMDQKTDDLKSHFSGRCDDLDSMLQDKVDSYDEKLEDIDDALRKQNSHFTRLSEKQDQHFEAKISSHDGKISKQDEYTRDVIAKLTQTMQDMKHDISMATDTALTEINRKHSEKILSQDGKLDGLRNDVTKTNNAIDGLRNQIDSRVQDEKVDTAATLLRQEKEYKELFENLKQTQADVDFDFQKQLEGAKNDVDEHFSHFTSRCTDIETGFSAKNAEQDAKIEQTEVALSSCHNDLQDDVIERTGYLQKHVDDVQSALVQHQQFFEESHSKMTSDMTTASKSQRDSLDSEKQKLASELQRLEQRTTESHDAHETVITQNYSQFKTLHSELQRLVTEKTEQIDGQIQDLVNVSHVFRESIEDASVEVERKVKDVLRQSEARFDAVTSDLDERSKRLSQATARAEENASDANGLTEARITDVKRDLLSSINELEQKATKLGNFQETLKLAVMHDGSLIKEHHATFTTTVGQLTENTKRQFKQLTKELVESKAAHQEVADREKLRIVSEFKTQEVTFRGLLEDDARTVDMRVTRLTGQVTRQLFSVNCYSDCYRGSEVARHVS